MPFKKTNILLIEDHPGDITLIEEYLLESGLPNYELFVSRNLAKGRQTLSTEKIDIILLDLILPDSIGFETFEKVSQEFSHCPIIVLTGVKDEQMGIRAVKYGAQNFISKFDLNGQLLGRSIQFAIEQKQLLLKLERAQSLAKIGNWELNLQTNLLACSSQILEILNKSPQETISLKDYLIAIPDEDQKVVVGELQRVLQEGGKFEVDHRINFPEHRQRYVNFRGKAQMNRSGKPHNLVGTIQDITDRKEIETLKQEREFILKAARLRQEFLAKTSHEVRTPLNPILLLTNLLLETDLDNYQREQLSVIKKAGETLLAVVNDILDISKIEAGKIDFITNSFSINQVFDHIEDMMAQNARNKSLQLVMSIDPLIPPKIIGDNVRLNQILLNLVGNAIKFTQAGKVEVYAKAAKLNEEKVTILFFVKDTGIGIPRDKLKWVFESFQQIDNETNQKSGGTGLGLTIVKQLVTLQGGKISIDSGAGEGSEFKIELEFGIGDLDDESSKTNVNLINKEKFTGLKVLLVEDNELNQMVTKKLLSDWGIILDIADNGREGIQKLQQNSYDLILMDVQMPEMDGYQATRYIRSELEEPKRSIPIIALTATALSGIDDECRKAGMDDFISKPIEVNSLFTKIAQYATFTEKIGLSQDNINIPAQVENLMDKPVTNYQTPRENIENSAPNPLYTDLSYLKEISGGDDNIIKKTIEKFLETTPDMLRSMNDHLQSQDLENLGRCAHKLKSSVAFMGIDTIKDTILEIEGITKNGGNEKKLPQLVDRIRQVIEASYQELQTDLATI